MKNFNAITILLLVLIPFLNSCCKKCQDPSNPDCENYDPCFRKLSADFKMGTFVYATTGRKYFDIDTCHLRSEIIFQAEDSSDVSYEWKIGSDPSIFTDKKVTLVFEEPTKIDVRLIVKKKGNCSTVAPNSDTIIKRLIVSNSQYGTFFDGKYHGYLESNTKDTFNINIIHEPFFSSYINDLPQGCNISSRALQIFTQIGVGAYRDFEVGEANFSKGNSSLGACTGLSGWGQLGKDNSTLKIEFKHYKNDKIINDKFIGKKIK